MKPLVSVAVISYKHAKYLATCLDSLLSQKTNFDYEVIVGEDCSNDGSREILQDYLVRYPEKLVVIFNEKNLGVSQNSTNVLRHCRGKYIAGFESDDFWCDENKLQKQVDYLETHPEIAAVGSNYYYVNEDGDERQLAMRYGQTDRIYKLKDFLRHGFIVHGNTLLRRRETTPVEEEKFINLRNSVPTQGDVITRCLVYSKGSIYVFPEPMICHRDGNAVASSFTAQNRNGAILYTNMHKDLLLNINEYFDNEINVTTKLCHRMGYILMAKICRKMNFEMSEYLRIFNTMKFSHKCLTVWCFIIISVEKVYNSVYWKFNNRSQYKSRR